MVVGVVFLGAVFASAVSRPGAVASVRDGGTAAGAPVVVMAELFTSEGCSSCPPADDVLTRLISSQPIPGVVVVGLGEHVDYWDRLGWTRSVLVCEPHQPAVAVRGECVSDREHLYAADGDRRPARRDRSDFGAIRKAVLEAAKAPKATLTVSARRERDAVSVDLDVDVAANVATREPADVIVAITEDRLVTEVHRGENRGRTLRHTAVVRSLMTVGELTPGDRTLTKSVSSVLGRDWKSEHLRIVAFAQERQSRIVGVGAVGLADAVEQR